MTVIEAPAATPAGAAGAEEAARPSGLAGLLGTADHIGLGRLWVLSSLLFLLVAGAAGALVSAERLDTSRVSILDEAVDELFNLHATAAIFLFLLPAFLGVATAVVPLQVGASTVAFPRAAAAAFWGWFLSGGVLIASYAVDGGQSGADIDGRLLWTVGLGGVVVSLCLASVCVVTTVWALRTAGMSLDRVPPFSWTMFVSGIVWLLALPVLLAGLVLAYLESRYGTPLDAGSLLRWAFSAPQVFAYALPALGLLLEVVPVAAGVRQRHHVLLISAVAAVGILAFSPELLMAARDPSITEDALYVGVAFALVLPFLAVAGGAADSLRRGRLNLTSPLLFGIVALLALLLGAVANAARVIDGLDLVGTTADTSVVHLVLAAGAVGVVGALHHWSSKILGTMLSEAAGRAAAVLLLIGGVVLAVPDLVSGLLDQPAGLVAGLEAEDGVEALNVASLIGGALVLLAVVLVLVTLIGGATRRAEDPVPDDPWGGHTLEWRTSSPPQPGGPGPLDPVTSPAPLLDLQEGQA
jgi:heme/copper-type cytochrome/quinol oxidase subunit 1